MPTLQALRNPDTTRDSAYWGERGDWLVALSQHRDSDTVDRSNWRVIVPAMLADYPDDAATESMSHWAVGWVEYLLVRPGTPAADAAQTWADKLADYPLADEEDYSLLEWSEEWCARCDRATREEHDGGNGGCARFRSAEDVDDIRSRWDARRRFRADRKEAAYVKPNPFTFAR